MGLRPTRDAGNLLARVCDLCLDGLAARPPGPRDGREPPGRLTALIRRDGVFLFR